MNSYNENLHDTVSTSLESQQTSKKQLYAQLNASRFTLYSAEGGQITAAENLDLSTKTHKEKQHINDIVAKHKNRADSLLLYANQQKKHTEQSVANMAVCAANVQIAANAIVRLASDLGSIFSIVNAAYQDTQIYDLSSEAYNLINKTAYLAEQTSQMAMEASMYSSEINSSTVADQAKSTNASISSFLQITTADLNVITEIMTADNDLKSKAVLTTKNAEAAMKYSTSEYEASKKAYEINNLKFNHNLRVKIPTPFDSSPEGSFTVLFDPYKSPFSPKDAGTDKSISALQNPVKFYGIVLVKESKKSSFTLSAAEEILNSPSLYLRIPVLDKEKLKVTEYKSTEKNLNSKSLSLNCLQDSDNEPLKLGENYVAYLIIVFTDDYKKEINSFDNYLSAPSETFTLTETLNKAAKIIVFEKSDTTDKTLYTQKKLLYPEINFEVKKEDIIKTTDIEYRCFFLPYPDDFLTESNHQKQLKNNKAFFFNLDLAEHIPAGNYTVATPIKTKSDQASTIPFEVKIVASTTDNFGNPMIGNKKYIPVVLSFFVGNETDKKSYTNALSDWKNTDPFTFSVTENKNYTN